jgi:hypothetical protein
MVLTVTPSTQGTGGSQVFTITGGPPNAKLAWSSSLNGQPTGEDHAMYSGQMTDANGAWSAAIGWPANGVLGGKSIIGQWTKTVYAYPPDMSDPWEASASFNVVQGQGSATTTGTTTGATTGTTSSSGGFLSGSITLPLVGTVPTWEFAIVLGVAGFVLLFPSGGKK